MNYYKRVHNLFMITTRRPSRQRGDTLIEVIMAIAVLAAAVVGALAVMNRGNAEALNALERSEVRTRVSAQAELLHYIRDEYMAVVSNGGSPQAGSTAALWEDIQARTTATASTQDDCTAQPQSFFVNNAAAALAVDNFNPADTPTTNAEAGKGLWIEAVRDTSPAPAVPFIDFYIKACWQPAGGTTQQRLSTVVRLYEGVPTAGNGLAGAGAAGGGAVASGCLAPQNDVVLTLDMSGSMEDMWNSVPREQKLRQMANDFVARTDVAPSQNHEAVIGFNDSSQMGAQLGSSVGQLQSAIGSFSTASGTNYLSGLNMAENELTSPRARGAGIPKSIIFISDGIPYPPDQIPSVRSKANSIKASGISIYTVGIAVDAAGSVILQDMAGNNGQYFAADDETQFEQAIATIASDFDCD